MTTSRGCPSGRSVVRADPCDSTAEPGASRLPSAHGHRGLVVGRRRVVPDAPQQEAEGVRRFRALDHADQDRLGFRVRHFIAGVVGGGEGDQLAPDSPNRWKVRVCRTRSNLTCKEASTSPISSRKTAPPSGHTSSQPARSWRAPVNAPRLWPNNSASTRLTDRADTFRGRNRSPVSWANRCATGSNYWTRATSPFWGLAGKRPRRCTKTTFACP